VLFSVACVVNNFYLTTFFNGHQGSLMFQAVAPYIIWASILIVQAGLRRSDRIGIAACVAVLVAFVLGAYPYPFFIGVAIVLYWGLLWVRKMPAGRRILLFACSIGALALFYVATWGILSPMRRAAIEQFRSWGTVFTEIGLFQFWGLWPSLMVSSSPVVLIWLNQNFLATLVSFVIFGLLCILAIYGAHRSLKHDPVFAPAFCIMFAAMFPLFYFSIGDPYYFYKFLYLSNFGWITLMLFGGYEVFRHSRRKVTKTLAGGAVIAWFVANLGSNLLATRDLHTLAFNRHTTEYADAIQQFGGGRRIYIDLPKRGAHGTHLTDHESVLRQYLSNAGIRYQPDPASAEYFLRMRGASDIALDEDEHVVWKNDLFRLITAPASDILLVNSFWSPEVAPALDPKPFRWISDGANNWLAVNIIRPSVAGRYLSFCAETGPGVGYRPIPVRLHDADGIQLLAERVGSFGCYSAEIAGKRAPFVIETPIRGFSASVIDTRHLNFRVSNIGLLPAKDSLLSLRAMNSDPDITPETSWAALKNLSIPDSGAVFLESGWFSIESTDRETFRWAHDGAEILVASSHPGILSLDLQPGPTLAAARPAFAVHSANTTVVRALAANSRSRIDILITPEASGREMVKLNVDSPRRAIPRDWRELDFRVFAIQWRPMQSADRAVGLHQ
jgi:hypothetical protein